MNTWRPSTKMEWGQLPKWLRERQVTFNGQIITLEQLRWSMPLWVQSTLDKTLFPEVWKHIFLPTRWKWESGWDYRVASNRMITYKWPKSAAYKDIWPLEPHESENNFSHTLPRELVIRLKWLNDAFTTEFFSIARMAHIVMRCAHNPSMRQFISENMKRAQDFNDLINRWQKVLSNDHKSNDDATQQEYSSLSQVEARAQQFYDECKNALKLTPMDCAVISTLSWDWKNPYTHTGLQYSCWCWVIITTVFWLIKTEWLETRWWVDR